MLALNKSATLRSNKAAIPLDKRPPIIRRGFAIVLSLTLLIGYVAFKQFVRMTTVVRSTKSTTIVDDLEMQRIDKLIDDEMKAIRSERAGKKDAVSWTDFSLTLDGGNIPDASIRENGWVPDGLRGSRTGDGVMDLVMLAPVANQRRFLENPPMPAISLSLGTLVPREMGRKILKESRVIHALSGVHADAPEFKVITPMSSSKMSTAFTPLDVKAEWLSDILTRILNDPPILPPQPPAK